MTHDRLLIHALADDQLSAEERKSVEDHLESCADCRAEFATISKLKTVVRERLDPVDVKSSWAKCRKRLDELDRAAKVDSFVTRYAWGFCSLFLVVILGAAILNHTLGRNAVHTADVAQMASGLIPLPVPRSNAPKDVRNWLTNTVGDRLPMNIRPQLGVVNAARGYHDGHDILRLELADSSGLMTLYIISNAEGIDGLEPLDSVHDYSVGKMGKLNCVAWTDRGRAMLILGDRSIAALCSVAEQIGVR